MSAPRPSIEKLRQYALTDLANDGLPKVPLVLELADEVRQIQARHGDDREWVFSKVRPRDRVELARRRERYEADEERLRVIGRFLALAQQAGRRHRLTVGGWFAMLEEQGYKCAICRFDLGVESMPCVDHNHSTGQVRGLLCGSCNTGLGHLKDSPHVLRTTLRYLEERGYYGPGEDE